MMNLGASITHTGCSFKVWAPLREKVEVRIVAPVERYASMSRDEMGYWTVSIEGIGEGCRYFYRLDGEVERPDPASQSQPDGVHGPSKVVNHMAYDWSKDVLCTRRLEQYIIYELHFGTFTKEGTFEAAARRLPDLVALGITAVEIMPVAQFPGERNWGYDGVYPFAVQRSYGGVAGFKLFVDMCHQHNLAVVLDVVYNHLGPEGNYLRDFGPYFTDRYETPWGESLNFDGPHSDEVCAYFIDNACYWLKEFRIDALRLDAVHAICDMGAQPFLQRLSRAVEQEFPAHQPPKYLIAESDLNDVRVIRDRSSGGFGLHAQWSDDFHHALHTVLTGEQRGYYADFGGIDTMFQALHAAFCYTGNYSPSRKRSHGNDASMFETGTFVVCSQNHDQIGNRMLGERLISLAGAEQARLAAAVVILSPYIPLLFMGEEHGEDAPFLYFADHSDESLKQAVQEGRKAEFAGFHAEGEPPDPFALSTLEQSRPDWSKQASSEGASMRELYRRLIEIRKTCPAIGPRARKDMSVHHHAGTSCITVRYYQKAQPVWCVFNFDNHPASVPVTEPDTGWRKLIDSVSTGSVGGLPERIIADASELLLPPFGFVIYEKDVPDTQKAESEKEQKV
jgi:maltooligosyltrehalose trehalohydrolase